jgi:hypothetical protein
VDGLPVIFVRGLLERIKARSPGVIYLSYLSQFILKNDIKMQSGAVRSERRVLVTARALLITVPTGINFLFRSPDFPVTFDLFNKIRALLFFPNMTLYYNQE